MIGLSKYQRMNIQKALQETTGQSLVIDGALGEKSLGAFKALAATLGLPTPSDWTGEAFEHLQGYIKLRFVDESAFMEAAKSLGVDEASVRAIAEVESLRSGFQKDGRLTILFERHWFYKKLQEALKSKDVQSHILGVLKVSVPEGTKDLASAILDMVAERYPSICSATAGGYTTGKEWERMDLASSINLFAAHSSASYGSFQLMGFNHEACGYNTPTAMLLDLAKSETIQFKAFVSFVKNDASLLKALKAKNWAAFARGYNGPAYAKNKYDVKMKDAYDKWVVELKK